MNKNTLIVEEITQAKTELIRWQALEMLAQNNDLASHIEIAGINLGVCSNKKLIPVIRYNIKEINKFLKGEPNLWE